MNSHYNRTNVEKVLSSFVSLKVIVTQRIIMKIKSYDKKRALNNSGEVYTTIYILNKNFIMIKDTGRRESPTILLETITN